MISEQNKFLRIVDERKHFILFRFMSYNEAIKLLQGETLHNDTDFKKNGSHTSSKGFCFMDGDKEQAEYAYNFLGGVVSDECCLILRFNHNTKLTESSGRYADPYGAFFDTINVNEVCTDTYNDKMFTPIRYALNVDYDEFTWHDMVGERDDIIKVFEQARDEKLEEARQECIEEENRKEERQKAAVREDQMFYTFFNRICNHEDVEDCSYDMYSSGIWSAIRRLSIRFKMLPDVDINITSYAWCNVAEDVKNAVFIQASHGLPKEYGEKMLDTLMHIIGKMNKEEEYILSLSSQ